MNDNFEFLSDEEVEQLKELGRQHECVRKLLENNASVIADPGAFLRSRLAKIAITFGNDIDILLKPDSEEKPVFLSANKSDAKYERLMLLIQHAPKLYEALQVKSDAPKTSKSGKKLPVAFTPAND